MRDLKLGIIMKDNRIINHRSLIKVLLNPFLRCFGFCIATKMDQGRLGLPIFSKCDIQFPESYPIPYDYEYDQIIKKRRII